MLKKILSSVVIIIILIYNFKDEVYSDNIIVLGSSLPKTGIMKELGINLEQGAKAYFNYANENNIIKNKKIKLLTYDDKYEPEITFKNINKLIDNKKVFGLFGFVGTPTIEKILPIIYKTEIPFIAPFTGASFLRDKRYTSIVNFRANYAQEIEKIVSYLHDKKDLRKFAIFYQNDNYGEEVYISLIKALNKRNLELISVGTYKRNTLSIRNAFQEMKDTKPEVIIMIGAYKANTLFINKAQDDDNFKDTIFCNISFGVANTIIKDIKNTKNLLFTQVVPNYMDKNIPIVKEYHKIMNKYFPNTKYGFISFESFLAAKIVVYSLSQIQGNITKEKFLFNLKNIPTNILNGLDIKYKNSQLLNKVYLYKYENNKFYEIQKDK